MFGEGSAEIYNNINASGDEELIRKYAVKYNISEKIISILIKRGIKDEKSIEDFINPDISKLRNPFDFENMDAVIERIIEKKDAGEKIFIYGDYDVDGITSAAFLSIICRNAGIKVDYYIPDRMEEGYGLNKNAIDYIKSQDGKLIITVDMGVNSRSEVEYAKAHGIEIIVTDHHKIIDDSDNGVLVINPKVSQKYGFKSLSGAGVALKVAQALYTKLNISQAGIYEYMDIVMIGTVADVVPMVDENRIIIKKGLEVIKKTKVKGLVYLLNYLKLKGKDITTTDISFFVSPLLNALGRIGNSKIGVDFFLEDDEFTIYNIIEEMKNANKKRRSLEKIILSEVVEILDKDMSEKEYIFLKSEKWHPGVIGVVAAKLSIRYNIPVILISLKDGLGKASCRSAENINIFEILKKKSEYFVRFGGHDLAAGFIAREENLDIIENGLRECLIKKEYCQTARKEEAKPDLQLMLSEIDTKLMDEIKILSPFGIENPHPIFTTKDVYFTGIKKFGTDNQHFKSYIKGKDEFYSAVGFNLGAKVDRIISLAQSIDIVYYPEMNIENNEKVIQLKIKDFMSKNDFDDIFENK